MGHERRTLIFVTATTLFLAGCGLSSAQRDAVGQFSTASAAFGDTLEQQLVAARNDVVEMRSLVLATDPRKLSAAQRDKIDGAFAPANLGPRLRAAKVIKSYGELLSGLVQDTQQKELEAASTKFTQSVRGLDPDKQRISDEQLSAIGEMVAAIGGVVVEYKKARAVKAIVPAADEQIKVLATLIADEFAAGGPIARNVDQNSLLLAGTAESALDSSATVVDRSAAAAAFRKALEASRKANAVFPAVSQSAKGLMEAHAALVKALADDRLTQQDIKTYVKAVEDLISNLKVFAGG